MSDSLVPENTDRILYIRGDEVLLSEIIEKAIDHFGEDIEFNELTIGREHFHARCIGYDLYDSGDYDDYIFIKKEWN